MTLLLAAALLPAPPVCAPAGSDFQLELRPKRTWSIELPADPFRKVSGSIPVPHANGAGFTAEVRGVGLALDTDGDGEVDRVVEGREHPETKVRYARVDLAGHRGDGTPFTYPVRLEVRAEGWAWASSAVMEGSLDGTPIEVIDLDGNGRFGDVGADAVVVGGTDVAQFLGRTVSADGQLYRLDVAGQRVSLLFF